MVGLVAVAVVGKTISMVLGPGQLKLVIRWGFVGMHPAVLVLPPGGNVTIRAYGVVYNPTIYDITFNKIKAQLLDVTSSPPAKFFSFDVPDQIYIESLARSDFEGWDRVPFKHIPGKYLSELYDRNMLDDIAMWVQGTRTMTPQSPERPNRTSQVVYLCWPLVLACQLDPSRRDVFGPLIEQH
jgi:hypothetical protein